jgi:long-chain acyl-CoA synthetase
MTALQTELLARLAGSFPDAVAWKDLGGGQELTIGSWHTLSNRLARGLHERGLEPGVRVALAMAEDSPLEWLVSYMAIHKAGCVAVPLNTRLSGPETMRILQHAGVAALLATDTFLDRVPTVTSFVGTVAALGTGRPPALPWSNLLDPDGSDIGLRLGPDDHADVMYTSGTTGAPKGVVIRHGGLSASDRVPSAWHGLGFITSSPFFTTSGSLLICGPMRGGLSGWFLPRFEAGRWLSEVAAGRPVAAFLVPAMVQLLVRDVAFESADLSSLAVVNVGSAPIASETLRQFGQRLPSADVMCGYGMTEFGAVTAMPPRDKGGHLGSVGPPLPGVRVRIVGPDGAEVGAGELGQVVISGSRAPRTYLNDETAAATTWEGGWLQSGDLGFLDRDGYLWIVGRQKDLIIRGGHNIMPGEVEAALFEHPEVADAAVAGVPHPILGEDLAAWVVRRGSGTPSLDSIRSFLADRLADYKVPRRITFVDALPRNDAGKVMRAQLVSGAEHRSAP